MNKYGAVIDKFATIMRLCSEHNLVDIYVKQYVPLHKYPKKAFVSFGKYYRNALDQKVLSNLVQIVSLLSDTEVLDYVVNIFEPEEVSPALEGVSSRLSTESNTNNPQDCKGVTSKGSIDLSNKSIGNDKIPPEVPVKSPAESKEESSQDDQILTSKNIRELLNIIADTFITEFQKSEGVITNPEPKVSQGVTKSPTVLESKACQVVTKIPTISEPAKYVLNGFFKTFDDVIAKIATLPSVLREKELFYKINKLEELTPIEYKGDYKITACLEQSQKTYISGSYALEMFIKSIERSKYFNKIVWGGGKG